MIPNENIFIIILNFLISERDTNPIISSQGYHLTQPCQSEEKQTNKNSAQNSSYMKLTQTTGPTLGRQGKKRKK